MIVPVALPRTGSVGGACHRTCPPACPGAGGAQRRCVSSPARKFAAKEEPVRRRSLAKAAWGRGARRQLSLRRLSTPCSEGGSCTFAQN